MAVDIEFVLSQIYAILVIIYQIVRYISSLSGRTRFDPQKDVVVITGGSSGLGYVITLLLSIRSSKIAVLDVKDPEVKIPNVNYYICDVGDNRQVIATFTEIARELGPVTILINNAAISKRGSLIDMSVEDIDKTIHVNLLSHFYTTKAVLPCMIEMNRGYIVSISSSLGFQGPIEYAAYAASKSALLSLHESLTYELVDYSGIQTLIVIPGQMKTSMFQDIVPPLQFFAPVVDPRDLAKQIIDSLELGRSGKLALPLYVNFMPIIRVLPPYMIKIFRSLSGMDKVVREAVIKANSINIAAR
ncbi:hypothetical protein V1511DRAFT_489237 [Dipodascopsis uninucleata]